MAAPLAQLRTVDEEAWRACWQVREVGNPGTSVLVQIAHSILLNGAVPFASDWPDLTTKGT